MSDYIRGIKRGMEELFFGFIISSGAQILTNYLALDTSAGVLFQVLSMIMFFEGFGRKRYWHTKYIVGWLVAVFLLGYFGRIMEPLELTYQLVGTIYIYARRSKIDETISRITPW